MRYRFLLRAALSLLVLVVANPLVAQESRSELHFRDVAEETGVRAALKQMHGHAAAWGDVDGDGDLDLYVGAFHKDGTRPNVLLLQQGGKFVAADQEVLKVSARSSGSIFVDFDNDGDLDFYLSNLSGGKSAHMATDNKLFRNEGSGKFTDVSADSGACPAVFRGRSVSAVDFDGDGLLDLLLGESLAYGSTKHSRLLRNLGNFRFDDITAKVGLPPLPALGVAVGDVNNDGWPDLLFVAADGGNRLFLNERGTRIREAVGVSKVLQSAWKYGSGDDTTSAAVIADVNRDGWLDIVLGHHFERPWLKPVPIRLYLNQGVKDGEPTFVDVTDSCGLIPLPMKAAHVEVQDFDNDGWPEIYVSMVKFADGKPFPLIFQNQSSRGGKVAFREEMLKVNDYPNAEDRAIERTGTFFDKMIKDGKIIYTAAAPSGDFDGDGRVDLFLSSWWVEAPALLLKNETKGGNWLDVQVRGSAENKVNRNGIGARVSAYPAGKSGAAEELLGCVEIAVGYGYSSGQQAIAHLGLGERESVDLVIQLPHGRGEIKRPSVKANQRLVVDE